MLEPIKEVVSQIVIFMICAQAIVHFRPKDAYEKYFKMLLSVMILIQIFQPFCSFFLRTGGLKLSDSVERFQSQLDSSMEAAARQSQIAEKKLEAMSLLEVQERVAEQKENMREAVQEETMKEAGQKEVGEETEREKTKERAFTAQETQGTKIEQIESIQIEVN